MNGDKSWAACYTQRSLDFLSCLCCGRNGCSAGVREDFVASLWKCSVEKYKNRLMASVSSMRWKSRVQTWLWFAPHGHDRMGRKGHEIYMLHRHTHTHYLELECLCSPQIQAGRWITKISSLNSCSSILSASDRERFMTGLSTSLDSVISFLLVVSKPWSHRWLVPLTAAEEEDKEDAS